MRLLNAFSRRVCKNLLWETTRFFGLAFITFTTSEYSRTANLQIPHQSDSCRHETIPTLKRLVKELKNLVSFGRMSGACSTATFQIPVFMALRTQLIDLWHLQTWEEVSST